jgi:release factor glutamine methyltransferase
MKVPMTPTTISELIAQCATYLAQEHEQATAEQYAWWLLEALTKQSRAVLIAQQKITLDKHQAEILSEWLDDIVIQHKPLAYVLGNTPFRELNIFVQAPTLIPRPETEEWVSALIEQYKPLAYEPLRILDLCTGTGCIALSLAHAFPQSSVVGVDISDHALALAHKNAQHNMITNVTFIHSDLFSGLPPSTRFDLIVANPPYIAHEEQAALPLSVKQWEDPQALFADDKGLALITAIIEQAPHWLSSNPIIEKHNLPNLAIEIGHTQGAAVVELFNKQNSITHSKRNEIQPTSATQNSEQQGEAINVECLRDYAGKDRVVRGSIKHVVSPHAE